MKKPGSSLSRLVAYIVTSLILCHLGLDYVAGSIQVQMYQIDEGPRSINSNATLMTDVSGINGTIIVYLFKANSSVAEKTAITSFSYASSNAPTTQSIPSGMPLLSLSTNSNKTSLNIVWLFTFLPAAYDELTLTTRVQELKAGSVSIDANTTLAVIPCPGAMSNSILVNQSEELCGYDCTGRFICLDGYTNQSYVNFNEVYLCKENAQWNPAPPVCVEKAEEVTTTATMLFTTSDKETPEWTTSQATSTTISSSSNTAQGSGCKECDCCPEQNAAAIAITVTGGIFVVAEIVIVIYSCIKELGVLKAILLHAAFGVCAFVWTASVIVLFVVPDNCKCTVDGAGNCICTAAGEGECICTAYIAGATIGGITIVGEAVSVGIHIWAIATIKQEVQRTPGRKMEN